MKQLKKDLYDSFKALRQDPKLLAVSLTLDLSFFVASIYLFYTFYLKAIHHLVILMQIGEERGQQALDALSASEFTDVMSRQAEFMQHYQAVISLFLTYLVIGYILYIILQGLNWHLTDVFLHNNKIGLKHISSYLGKFFLANIIWLIGLGGILFLIVDVLFWNSQSENPLFPPLLLNIIALIILAAYFYFVSISYALLLKHKIADSFKQTFVRAFNRQIALTYASLVLLFVIAVLILRASIEISIPLGLVLIGGFFMPLISFSRICFLKVLHQ